EIRNMALLSYLQGRTETKNRILDVLEDFAWFNDKSSPTTISDADDPLGKSHPVFPLPNRAESERHIAALPKVSLLELLPGVRLAERVESSRIAELVSAPFKWGSYAMVVGPSRSGNSQPCLLSAPQMGLRTPSIIHEMSITAPGYQAVGMDVPGVPGIAIGYTPYLAWGLTSGVADTDDIVFTSTDSSGYVADGKHQEFEVQRFPLAVKGGSATTVEQRRTVFGPVVVDSNAAKVAFSRKSASRMRELESLRSVLEIGSVSKVENVDDALRHATVNFNCFYATRDGHVGYRFTGLVPDRKAGYDPRFPLPATPTALWTGTIPFEKMPAVRDPKMGLLANWNNKPVSWWPNSDTPVWGQIFRNQEILKALGSNKLIPTDLERAAWTIARRDETWDYFKPLVQNVWQGSPLEGFDGWMLDGSIQAQVYRAFFDDLREAIFLPVTGNFIAPDNFKLIAQPSVMLKALQGKTKIDYLRGRKAAEVIKEALDKSTRRLAGSNLSPRFVAPPISVPGQPPIPYSNRGTYIQIVELMPSGPQGRNVVTPGVAEAGDHSLDQVPLARAWIFKLMRF
ncbi:MAG TPA: penicillin acylase family protein, partial [Fimbriimonadaceae bacterium]|nr:penicillin acylase family protein [Fimbriimonadaceae bacterium]